MKSFRTFKSWLVITPFLISVSCKTAYTRPPNAEASGLQSESSSNQLKSGQTTAIEYRIAINATAEKAWAKLVNFKDYDKWNRWMVRLDGEPKLDAKLKGMA